MGCTVICGDMQSVLDSCLEWRACWGMSRLPQPAACKSFWTRGERERERERDREREREREREGERETNRQTDRQTDTERYNLEKVRTVISKDCQI